MDGAGASFLVTAGSSSSDSEELLLLLLLLDDEDESSDESAAFDPLAGDPGEEKAQSEGGFFDTMKGWLAL